jgi:hypothetical protein
MMRRKKENVKFCLCQALSVRGRKNEALSFLTSGLDSVGSFTLRPLYPDGKIMQFPFNSGWGVLQSRSKRFRGELKLMILLRIEPKFLGWVYIRTGLVYLTVVFRNVGNAHKWSQNVFGIYLSYNDGKVWFWYGIFQRAGKPISKPEGFELLWLTVWLKKYWLSWWLYQGDDLNNDVTTTTTNFTTYYYFYYHYYYYYFSSYYYYLCYYYYYLLLLLLLTYITTTTYTTSTYITTIITSTTTTNNSNNNNIVHTKEKAIFEDAHLWL